MKTTWIIYTTFGRNAKPYYLDVSDFGISKDEVELNIIEQVYGGSD